MRRRRLLPSIALLVWLSAGSVFADNFEQGMSAFEDQDYSTAFEVFSRLAEAGDADAQYMLGRLYARGRGVLQDYVQAHRWFNLASAGGQRQASQALDQLSRQMTPEQVSQAQQLARGWQPGSAPAAATIVPDEIVDEGMIGRIQLMLNKFGYSAGAVNGKLTDQTRAAISDYQMENLLPVDGRASKALLTHLSGANQAPVIALSPSDEEQTQAEPNWQWRRLVVRDNFTDGNFTANPSWTVVAGRFWIEGRAGLRSAASGDNPRINQPDRAEIYVEQGIGSAFAIRARISARQPGGRLEFGPYRGGGRSQGYRLFYSPDNEGRFGIRRISVRGASVMMSQRRFQLADGGEHSIVWTKDGNGVIVVSFDGSEVMRFTDPEFRQGFDGFIFINRGGEYGLREIRINSAG